MSRRHYLLATLAQAPFRRLYAVRLAGQLGDGIFQASLAGAVLFDPERQAHASDIAFGFAVLLIPYSIIGPFAGVLQDRFSRQRLLVLASLARAVCVLGVAAEIATGVHGQPFYASALVVLSLSRFFLSALSASLPHVVAPAQLATANSLSTTSGTVATTLGGVVAIGARTLTNGGNHAYAAIALTAALAYLSAALLARRIGVAELGPDEAERRARETVGDVARGLLAGARHIASRKPAAYALTAIGVQRLAYGVSTVSMVLLYRNYFHDDGIFRAGLAGLAQMVGAVAVGGALAAFVTPLATRTIGFVRWQVAQLLLSGVATLAFGLTYRMPLMLFGAFVLGFAAQAMKVSTDTLVQRTISDAYRGRVFSLYDALFNLSLVLAAALTAAVLPESGHLPAAVIVIAAVYLVTAAGYARRCGRLAARTATATAAQPQAQPQASPAAG